MPDITMCTNEDCPNHENCWRLLAPPSKFRQSYALFEFDYAGFEAGTNTIGCDYYIAMDELEFNYE